jgi:hypothetical protein
MFFGVVMTQATQISHLPDKPINKMRQHSTQAI